MDIQPTDLIPPTNEKLRMTEEQACDLLFKLRDDDEFRALLERAPMKAFRSLGLSPREGDWVNEAAKAIPSKQKAREAIEQLERAQQGKIPYLNWDYIVFVFSVLAPGPRPRKPRKK